MEALARSSVPRNTKRPAIKTRKFLNNRTTFLTKTNPLWTEP